MASLLNGDNIGTTSENALPVTTHLISEVRATEKRAREADLNR